jgi:hypothetical protein
MRSDFLDNYRPVTRPLLNKYLKHHGLTRSLWDSKDYARSAGGRKPADRRWDLLDIAKRTGFNNARNLTTTRADVRCIEGAGQ